MCLGVLQSIRGIALQALFRGIQYSGRASSENHTHTGNVFEQLSERSENEQLQDVMSFWGRLNDYRERNCSRLLHIPASDRHIPLAVTSEQASRILEDFKYHELWWDLTRKQQQSKGWRSTVGTIPHKRAGWTHAAKAIMEYGLPKLEQPADPNDATEHVNAMGQFARDMAKWLIKFAGRQHAYHQTEEYRKNYQKSIETMHRRHKGAFEAARSEAWT